MTAPAPVMAALERGLDQALADLIELARIPSVSAPDFEPKHVERCAECVAGLLERSRLDGVELLRIPGAHPYVVAEKRAARADAPSVLVYAHHDVQPPGRPEHWLTPAFEPTLRADGRLYGRGVVDDKAGLLLHLAALRAWLAAEGAPPLHVKLIVEGEEEIGSGHLAEFLRLHRERLAADVIVLSDTANLATGVPALTTSLRGLVAVDVTVRALDHPIHSGFWGGPVPDAATALTRLLSRLVDDASVIQVPGLLDDVPALSVEQRAALAALPFDEAALRVDSGMLAGTRFSGEPERSLYERLWYRPSLAFTALEGMPLATAANQLIAEASARVGVRLAPGQDAERVARRLTEFLHLDPPAGVQVDTRVRTATPGWKTAARGPAFDAAHRALAAGYGRPCVEIGCGASIPFVGPFSEVLGGAPALLLGLEDPPCNAHGENESLDLDDFRRAARSSAHLLAELSRIPGGRLR